MPRGLTLWSPRERAPNPPVPENLRAEESIILGRRLSHSLGGKKIEDMPAENLRQVLQ